MGVISFRNLAYSNADEVCFGIAKKPLKYGFELSVGDGKVVPEVKYILKPGFENKPKLIIEEYGKITLSIMHRALNLGFRNVQLDTELTEPLTMNPDLSGEIAKLQKEILSRYYSEYGLKSALRITIADTRRFSTGLRSGEYLKMMIETVKSVSINGADLISVESRGGQEIFSYSLIRNDLKGILFSIAILSIRDVSFLWREIVKKCSKAIPAGDSACALANSAMVLANGLMERRISHILAAVIRAMCAVRTLKCYEEGAQGPGKDCAYENAIVKIITGYPISMEGKTASYAHSSLLGNISAAICDLWSNETIVFEDFFGGKSTAVILETLGYDAELMNKSIDMNINKTLQKILVNSDIYRDPQALILSPENAFRIAKSITSSNTDYERTVNALKESLRIIEEKLSSLNLPKSEITYLSILKTFLNEIPDEDELIKSSINKYSRISDFKPENYDLS
jgi:methanol--5-hydroxybenzimidazolylcobamide Co-methyltransferase